MKLIEKTLKWLKENNIEHEYDLDNIFESVKIWTSFNGYFWIRLYLRPCPTGKKRRTIITHETFDIECYRPNGTTYQGSISKRFSFDNFKRELIMELRL